VDGRPFAEEFVPKIEAGVPEFQLYRSTTSRVMLTRHCRCAAPQVPRGKSLMVGGRRTRWNSARASR